MRKNKKKNYLMLLLLLVLGVTVGYAFLSTTLNINGTTVIKDAKWNVYWDNPVVTTGSVTTTVPTIDSAKTTATFDITLNNPKDYYEFTIDAVNAGTIDAMIKVNGVSNKVYSDANRTTETTLPDAIKYTVTYEDGTAIAQNHLLAKKQGNTPTRETYKVRIEYRNDEQTTAQDLEAITEETTYYMTFSVEYVQADNSAVDARQTLSIGDTVNYSTSMNGVTLDNWKVFYVDDDYTYLIYERYLPTSAVGNISGIVKYGRFIYYGNYQSVSCPGYMKLLVNSLTTTSNWDELVTNGKINGISINQTISENVWAIGSPTLELWVKSWNQVRPEERIYITKISQESGNGLEGYYISKTENTSDTGIDVSTEFPKKTLFFPETKEEEDYVHSYWLASYFNGPDGSCGNYPVDRGVYGVYISQYWNSADIHNVENDSESLSQSIRPIIKLPTSVVNQ